MPYSRKYSGPLQRGKRSAYVPGTRTNRAPPPPKALQKKSRKRNYRASYKLTKPFKQVLDKFLDSKTETHWNSIDILREFTFQYPIKNGGNPPIGIYRCLPLIPQAGMPTVGHPGGVPDNIETRTGVKIRLKSMVLNLQVRLNPTFTGISGDISVDPEDAIGASYQIYILSCKAEKSYSDVLKDYFGSNGLNTQGLQMEQFKNGANPTQYDNLTEHENYPINTNLFTVHAQRSGRLAKGEATFPQGGGTSVRYPSQCHNVKLRVKCKSKTLKYAKPEDNFPANFDPFVVFFWKCQNGYSYIQHFPEPPDFVQICGNVATSWDNLE